ncbi:MAG: putative RNA methyltransferase [Oscillospiraceae bacterium]
MNCFICPVCRELLSDNQKSYICINNHVFDKAKSGYVNLLQSNHMHTKAPGDNKLMVNARRDFLNKGYYSPMMEKLCEMVNQYAQSGDMIIDAGCGEGYYTDNIFNCLMKNGINADIFGIDISKSAVDCAAKRNKNIKFAAASIFRLPFADNSADMLVTLFAPYCHDEFSRVIRKDGIMIMVIPSELHLWSLKKAVYDEPYKNEVKSYEIYGFSFINSIPVKNLIHIDNNTDIMNLFSMTPYYYKTDEKGQQRLAMLDTLDTETEFEILIYRKD